MKKRTFSFLILVALTFILVTSCSVDKKTEPRVIYLTENDLKWNFINNGTEIEITDCLVFPFDIIIPDELIFRPVTTLANRSFFRKGIKSITIPKAVTFIGAYAFANNQLTKLTLGNRLKYINEGVFINNRLTSVVIPDSVITIEKWAFMNNQITELVIGKNVTVIGAYAFMNNQLTSVTIPNNVTEIEISAFADNQITRITIGHNVLFGSDTAGLGGNFAFIYNRSGGTFTRQSANSTEWVRSR